MTQASHVGGVERTKSFMHEGTICVGTPPGDTSKGLEAGDSGGVVLVRLNSTELFEKPTWGLVGTHSHSIDNEARENYVSIATRVSSVYDWIESQITQRHILTHVFTGPLADSTATTEVVITNKTNEPCRTSVWFHKGTEAAPAVRFNGGSANGNRMEIDIQGGTAQKIVLTNPGRNLAVGAVYVEQASVCAANALQVEGRYLITSNEGQIVEAFSVQPQTENDWMSGGDCRTIAGDFSSEDDVGLAMVTAFPGQAALEGAQLTFQAYDWQGNFVGEPESLEVTGEQYALNPWNFNQPRLIRMCLDLPRDNGFQLSLLAIASKATSRNVQYSTQALISD